jgi:integrase
MDDFIDVHDCAKRLAVKEENISQDSEISLRNKEIILKYIRDSKLGKTILKGQKKKIGAPRILKTSSILTSMAKVWFKKDLDTITMEDMEQFVLDLEQGVIKSSLDKPFSQESQGSIKKFIRKFYKWLQGDNKRYPDLVEWIDTSYEKANIKAIPCVREGVEQIIDLIPNVMKKCLIMVAFDSGFRMGELLNVRLKDVEEIEGTFFITCRYSKTKPRTVSLPLSTRLMKNWLSKWGGAGEEQQLFPVTKRIYTQTINTYAKKALGVHITVHMIRHTSATYYATRLDRTSFCKRFGWSYGSDSPDRYIDFTKIEEKKVAEIINKEENQLQNLEVEQLRIQNSQLKERMDKMEEMQKRMELMEQKMAQQFVGNY